MECSIFNRELAIHRIKQSMNEKNMNQQELALLVGVSESTISKLINCTRGFTMDTYLRFKNALDLPLDYGLTTMDVNTYNTYLKYYKG